MPMRLCRRSSVPALFQRPPFRRRLARESAAQVLRLDDPPSATHQPDTACSSRGTRLTASRASTAVRATENEILPPGPGLGPSSQGRAACLSPSCNSTTRSKTRTTRSSRSDSSGFPFSQAFRRVRVRLAIWSKAANCSRLGWVVFSWRTNAWSSNLSSASSPGTVRRSPLARGCMRMRSGRGG